MKSLRRLRIFGHEIDNLPALFEETLLFPQSRDTLIRALGWISAGAGVLGLGLVVGRELRRRYKFNRRTPYDFYSHSGDEIQDMEFGVGI